MVPGRFDNPEDLPRGCGAVQQAGKDKVAVYKDEQGVEHTFAAACPHLGCLVQWNPLDGTFGAPRAPRGRSACTAACGLLDVALLSLPRAHGCCLRAETGTLSPGQNVGAHPARGAAYAGCARADCLVDCPATAASTPLGPAVVHWSSQSLSILAHLVRTAASARNGCCWALSASCVRARRLPLPRQHLH